MVALPHINSAEQPKTDRMANGRNQHYCSQHQHEILEYSLRSMKEKIQEEPLEEQKEESNNSATGSMSQVGTFPNNILGRVSSKVNKVIKKMPRSQSAHDLIPVEI